MFHKLGRHDEVDVWYGILGKLIIEFWLFFVIPCVFGFEIEIAFALALAYSLLPFLIYLGQSLKIKD